MAKATVLNFKVLNIKTGNDEVAPRRATREAIARAKGTPIEGTAIDVDEAELDGNGFHGEGNTPTSHLSN